MSANLRVLVPEGTTNYITNPSMRYVTTGWTAAGSTITRSLTKSRFGIASLKVVTNGSALYEGTFYRVNSLAGVNEPITVSAYVLGTGRVRVRLIDNPTGKEYYSSSVTLRTDRWTRLEATGHSTGSNDMRLYVETVAVKAVTFYVDGAQMERKAYSTTYCDGDQSGCRWNLEAHNSLSSRDPYTREGGRWVALAGPCRYNDNLYVTALGGLGMPPIENRTQSWAQAPGSYFQNIKVRDRVLTFNFFAKHKNLKIMKGADLSPIHELRQQLIDLIKPDKTAGGEAFLFEYDAGERPLYIRLRYEAGLEGEWDVRNGVLNAFPVRFVAVDPFFVEDNQVDYDLNFLTTFPIAVGREFDTAGRIDGVWSEMSPGTGYPGLENLVLCMTVGSKGEIYAGGSFATFYTRIARWNGTSWTSIGTANGNVYAIAVAPNGDLYATGAFTTIGGVACTRIAKYTQATSTWSALSTGLNDTGRALVVAPNGSVYIGGDFTTAGGTTVNRITRWDGSKFHVIGTPAGVDAIVYALALSRDGNTVYMGGDFTLSGTGAINIRRVAAIDTTTNLISVLGDNYGFNGTVFTLAVGLDGTLYAGGSFVNKTVDTSQAVLRVAKFQGYTWSTLGNGFANGTVYSLAVGSDGSLYIGGSFTLSSTLPVARIAKWISDTIYPVDFIPAKTGANTPTVYSIAAHPNGDVYLGMDGVDKASYAAARTTVTNTGTAEVKPVIYINGPGTLRYIENQTTGKKVHLNLSIFDDEEVFIDFNKGTITSARGDISYSIVNPSDIGDFSLIPGDNVIAAFMTDDVLSSMKITYIPQHWSADAVVDAEELQ